jgi:signal transduction histidine kinase
LLRETIWSFRQDAIQKGDLLEKISLFAEKRSEGKLEMCSALEIDPNEEIIASNALHLYRIAQEVINNAMKYSKATRIDIKFTRNSFTITDNGIGFDLSNYSPGYGIQNMKQRAEEMGAEFVLTSTEKGTTVRIENII